jgi:pyruvate/2-oxoglutarate dehydrogenase complex dihydrolipoamide dehydrogenase (E3) component
MAPLLIVGGGLTGLETADYLGAHGCQDITVVESLPQSPVSLLRSHGYMLHKRLQKQGVKQLFGAEVQKIDGEYVTVKNNEQETVMGPFKQIILALGTRPRNELVVQMEKAGIPYTIVGDAEKTGRIIEATESGANAAWNI